MKLHQWFSRLLSSTLPVGHKPKKTEEARPIRERFEAHPGLMRLESRRVLNAAAPVAPPPAHTAPAAVPAASAASQAQTTTILTVDVNQAAHQKSDTIVISRVGGNVDVSVNGAKVASQALKSIDQLKVIGTGSRDTVVIDLAGGNPLPTLGIVLTGFQGEGQQGSQLILRGGSAAEVSLVESSGHSGFLTVDGSEIQFSGFQSIQDALTTNNLFVAPTGSGHSLTLGAGLSDGYGQIQISSGLQFDFLSPTQALTIDVAGGDNQFSDTILVGNFQDWTSAALSFQGSVNDRVDINGQLGLEQGSLFVSAGTIDVSGSITGTNNHIEIQGSHSVTFESSAVVRSSGGTVVVDAGEHGTLLDFGVIDVSNTSVGGAGGTVLLLGQNIGIAGAARIDASGTNGGGTVLVGGDQHGANPLVREADRTYFGANASIHADALWQGDGGKVVLWSNEATWFEGQISAQGGALAGNGGAVEVSSLGVLNVSGLVNTLAAHGHAGVLLLDPKNVIINDSGSADLTDVDSFATASSATSQIKASVINTSTTDVVIQANTDITVNSTINISKNGVSLTMQAGRSILINSDISTNDGAITLVANETVANGVQKADRDGGAAVITMAAGTTIDSGKAAITITISTGAGLNDSSSGDITLANVTQTGAGKLTVSNNGPTDGGVILTGNISVAGDITFNDAVTLGDNVVLTSTGSGDISLASTINGTFDLTINTAGITTFGGAVGAAAAVNSITTDASGTTELNGGSIKTTGAQTFNDVVTLGATTTLTGNGNIAFGKTLDSQTATPQDLNISAGSGDVTFTGQVGTTHALGALLVTSSQNVLASASVTAQAVRVTATKDVTLTGKVTTTSGAAGTGPVTILADSDSDGTGTVSEAGGIDTSATSSAIHLQAAQFSLTGTIKSGTATTTLEASDNETIGLGTGAGDIQFSNTILALINSGALVIGGAQTGTITAQAVSTAAQQGPISLVAGATGANVVFSGGSSFTALEVTAKNQIQFNTTDDPAVQTTGAQTYHSPVQLLKNTTLTSTGSGN
ncbi:MAG: hypothetical protein JSS02_05800, partial [Planctomycetes bacterium]|nr:hypothetical protein [Planctomycetota bacterium]